MNILITGGNGFIAKSLHTSLSSKYSIVSIGRYDFDLTDREATNSFFKHRLFDVVIHCAAIGVSRLKVDINNTLDNNLSMYYNLLANKSNFNKLIHFGSGAEIYGKDTTYGLSKHVIQQSILEKDNFYNIRIFAVFDENELDTRFIKGNIIRYINKEQIIIHQDKFMDFFYMKDLVSLVDYYIQNENPPKEIDCSYQKSYSLLDIANIINELDSHKVNIRIEQHGVAEKYCGVPQMLLEYVGTEQGIKNVYHSMKK